MKITGTERIETEEGRIEVECDDEGVTVREWFDEGNNRFKSGDHIRLTWAEFDRMVGATGQYRTAVARSEAA